MASMLLDAARIRALLNRRRGAAIVPEAAAGSWYEAGDVGFWIKSGGTKFPIPDGEVLVGRGHECGIVVTNDLASREHCKLRHRLGRLDIVDLNSANGTSVNGRPLAGPQRLEAGDVIGIGTDFLEVVEVVRARRPRATMRDPKSALDEAAPKAEGATGQRKVTVDFVEAFVASASTMTGGPRVVAAEARRFVDILLDSAAQGDVELTRADAARLAAVAERVADWADSNEIEEWRGGVLAKLCTIPTRHR